MYVDIRTHIFVFPFLSSVFFDVVFSHRQALLPGSHQQFLCSSSKVPPVEREHLCLQRLFKFKQKFQDCFSLVQLRVYAHPFISPSRWSSSSTWSLDRCGSHEHPWRPELSSSLHPFDLRIEEV